MMTAHFIRCQRAATAIVALMAALGCTVERSGPVPGLGAGAAREALGFHAPGAPAGCAHVGSGRDIQVGNPAADARPGVLQVHAVGDVDWMNLAAGDTVRIFWRQAPYREKILLR